MAVVSVKENWKGRQATRNAENVREYTRTFIVQCDNMKDGPFTVGSPLTGIPPLYSYYLDQEGFVDRGALVVAYNPKQREEDPFFWDVEIKYSSAIFRGSPRLRGKSGRSGSAEQANKGSNDDNPLLRPIIIKVGNQKFQRELYIDLAGNVVANSAGEPFSNPVPLVDDTRLVFTVDRNELTYDPQKMRDYQDAVNADVWNGYEVGTCKSNVACESAFENGLYYWKYSYTVEVRKLITLPDGVTQVSPWYVNLFDKGSRVLGADGKLHNFRDVNDSARIAGQFYLDGNGNALGGTGKPTAANPPVWMKFLAYNSKPFAGKIPPP